MKRKESIQNWEKAISVVALVLSSVALILSWQANEIADKQFTPQTVILSAEFLDGNWNQETTPENWRYAYCEHKVRLSNLGGAPDSIVRYDALLEYKGQNLLLESSESQVLWSPGIQPYFVSINTELLSENLPLSIESFTTKEIIMKIGFSYDENLLDINVSYPYNPSYDYKKNIGADFSPLTVQFRFYTATSKALDTGKLICHYFK